MNFKTPPYKHQLEIFEHSKDATNYALFWEMGTGKSWTLLNTAAHLFKTSKIDAIVYIAKKGEYLNFSREELPKHWPDELDYRALAFSSFRWGHPTFQERFAKLLKLTPERLPILSVNVEALIYEGEEALIRFYKAYKRILLIVDESTCVKTHTAKRSKEVYLWAYKSAYRRLATGTPITRSPIDIYGQFLVFGKSVLGHGSFYSFRNTYCVIETQYGFGGRTFPKITGFKHLDDLTAKIKSTASILLKSDCLDLPEKIYERKIIQLSEEQARVYAKLRDEALVEIEGEQITVTNVLAQMVKLHQVACGQLKTGEDTYVSIENDRLSTLIDLLEEHDGKAIIWANYRQTIADVLAGLRKKFGETSTVAYYGGVSDKDRAANIDAFKHGEARFFVANPMTAGYGLTLTEADLVIYYSNNFSLEQRLQSEDRAHRIGQTKSVVYVDIVAEGTVDEHVVNVLRAKKNLADIVLERPLREWI